MSKSSEQELEKMLEEWLPGPFSSVNGGRRQRILDLFGEQRTMPPICEGCGGYLTTRTGPHICDCDLDPHAPIPEVREMMIEIVERATGEANIWDRRIVQEVFKKHGYEVGDDGPD